MALNNQPQKLLHTDADASKDPDESDSAIEEESELEELESEVRQMANKILEYRATLPDQLLTTCSSLLSVTRPVLLDFSSRSDPGTSDNPSPGWGEQANSFRAALLSEEEQKAVQRISLLRDEISSNVSAMPIVLKRMKECICNVEKLDSYNGTS